MPINSTNTGLSVLSAFGLLLTAIVLSYLNTTTSAFFWSTIYVGGVVVCSLACAAKLATALGAENKFAQFTDTIAGIVPFVAIYFDGIQALKYTHDGLSGFMACIAIIALVFVSAFGVADSLISWFGAKYQQATDLADKANRAVNAALDEAGRAGR